MRGSTMVAKPSHSVPAHRQMPITIDNDFNMRLDTNVSEPGAPCRLTLAV